MINTTLDEQIQIIVKDELKQIESPLRCEITKVYGDNVHVDAKTKYGLLKYAETISNQPHVGDVGVVIFVDEGYVVITTSATEDNSNNNITLNDVYPVGSIYMSVNDVDPKFLFGGEWEQIQDCFLLASGMASNGETGGEETHTLTSDEMPSHTHIQENHQHTLPNSAVVYNSNNPGSIQHGNTQKYTVNTDLQLQTNPSAAVNQNTGGGQAHNNMPPFLVVNMWKRVA